LISVLPFKRIEHRLPGPMRGGFSGPLLYECRSLHQRRGHQTFGGLSSSPTAKVRLINPTTGSRLAQVREQKVPSKKIAPTGDVCRGKVTHKEAMSVKRTQWEQTRPKGRRQCHACGDGEAQGQNYGCRHGNAPFLAVSSLPKQRKDICDYHHVLELFCELLRGLRLRQASEGKRA
jgi:hypothetical protein